MQTHHTMDSLLHVALDLLGDDWRADSSHECLAAELSAPPPPSHVWPASFVWPRHEHPEEGAYPSKALMHAALHLLAATDAEAPLRRAIRLPLSKGQPTFCTPSVAGAALAAACSPGGESYEAVRAFNRTVRSAIGRVDRLLRNTGRASMGGACEQLLAEQEAPVGLRSADCARTASVLATEETHGALASAWQQASAPMAAHAQAAAVRLFALRAKKLRERQRVRKKHLSWHTDTQDASDHDQQS